MKISSNFRKTSIKTIRQTDSDFLINDGLILTPRAGFEISSGCPYNYRQVIQECVSQGWLKPVAHMRDYEYTFDLLKS